MNNCGGADVAPVHKTHVCLIGGVHSYDALQTAININNFDFVQCGRALLRDQFMVNKWQQQHIAATATAQENISAGVVSSQTLECEINSKCTKCNICIVDATMSQRPISCIEW